MGYITLKLQRSPWLNAARDPPPLGHGHAADTCHARSDGCGGARGRAVPFGPDGERPSVPRGGASGPRGGALRPDGDDGEPDRPTRLDTSWAAPARRGADARPRLRAR